MTCGSNKCKCTDKSYGQCLNRFLDIDRCISHNIQSEKSIRDLFRGNIDFLESKGSYILLKVVFNSRVNLTSIILKSSFSELLVYTSNINSRNWKDNKPNEKSHVKSTDVVEMFITDRKLKDIYFIYIILSGEDFSKLEQINFKGTFISPKNRVPITSYQTLSTESIVKVDKIYNIY